MSLPEEISELLLLWEERREQGRPVSPEELCADHPELLPELRERVRALEAVYRLHGAVSPEATASPGPEALSAAGESDWPRISGYRIVGELGRGGMGIVYQAIDLRLHRPVALKIIPAEGAKPDSVERFLRESQAVAQVHHPNIVQVFELGTHGSRPYFTMEFVEGGTLAARVQHTPQPAAWAAQVIETLARAVHLAHERGVIHRDLKPSNVLLTPQGTPKVSDFGLAKRLQVEAGLTPSEAVLGTPSYMASEQAGGRSKQVGPATDVYSLGAILYELLTGRPPFQGDTALETMRLVTVEEPVPPRRLRPQTPADLETICLKCLRKEPAKRYASALALAEDLRRFQAREPIAGRRPHLGERLAGWGRRRPVLLALVVSAGLILAGALGGGAWFLYETRAAWAAAVQAKVRADASYYALQISLSQRELREGHLGAAADLLEKCHPDYRGWEYRYLSAECQRRLHILHGHRGVLLGVAYSPDGRFLAGYGAGGMEWPPDPWKPGEVMLWDLTTGQIAATFPSRAGPVAAVAFSPDSRYLVSADPDAGVTVWDVTTRQEVHTLPGPGGPVMADRPAFAAGVVGLLGTPQGPGPLLAAVLIPGRGSVALALSADGGRLVTAGGPAGSPGANVLHVRDARTGAAARDPVRLSGPLAVVALSPDGRYLAGADFGGTVTLWDLHTGTVVRSFAGASGPLTRLCFSPDGHRLAGVVDGHDDPEKPGELRVWDVETGKVGLTLPQQPAQVAGLAFSPDGRHLAGAGFDGTVRLWDTGPGSLAASYHGWGARATGVAFSPDGRHLASAGLDGTVKVWEMPRDGTARLTQRFPQAVRVAFRPDGRQLACAYGEPQNPDLPWGLALWDLGADHPPRRLLGHAGPVAAVVYSADGRRLASGGGDRAVHLWEPDTGRLQLTLPGHRDKVLSLAVSPDGRRLASGSACRPAARLGAPGTPGEVKLWDLDAGRELLSFPGDSWVADVSNVLFSPDGRRLVTSTQSHVRVWDAATGKERLTLQGNFGNVTALAVSADGRWLATGTGTLLTADHPEDVLIWDLLTGTMRTRLTGHAGMIQGIAFSPDGRRLATASSDRTVRLWDPGTGVEMLTLREHGKAVVSVAFSGDGVYLAAGGQDGTVRVWEAPP